MEETNLPKIGEWYKHFKGDKYMVIKSDIDADYNDGRKRIRYVNLKDKLYEDGRVKYPTGTTFSSSLERFTGEKVFEENEKINGVEYKKGDKLKRFEKINEELEW